MTVLDAVKAAPAATASNKATSYGYVIFGAGACRGTNQTDIARTSYYTVDNFAGDHSDCIAIREADSKCTAFEFDDADSHCEIWTTQPPSTLDYYYFFACYQQVLAIALRLDAPPTLARDLVRELPSEQPSYNYLLFGVGACQGPSSIIEKDTNWTNSTCGKVCSLDDSCKAISVGSNPSRKDKICEVC